MQHFDDLRRLVVQHAAESRRLRGRANSDDRQVPTVGGQSGGLNALRVPRESKDRWHCDVAQVFATRQHRMRSPISVAVAPGT